ncbi:hypothetical protein ACFLZB_04925, partial [Nanoarchaeota archaeon]
TYTGTLTAKDVSNSNNADTMPVSVAISQSPSATATAPSLEVAQGSSKSTTFTITNNGNTDLSSISLQTGTITDGNNALNGVSLSSVSSISYGSSAQVTVTVSPNSNQPTGTYTGPITINYDGSNSIQVTLSVTVDAPEHKVEITDSEIKLGSSTQERDQTVQTSFIVKNTGDYSESGISIALENVPSEFSATLSETNTFSLGVDSTKTITLTATIPDDQNGGIDTIGRIKVTYNNGATLTQDILLEAENMLSIDDLDIKVGGQDDDNLNDGDKINEEAKPGDEIEFQFEIKNLYSSSDDIELEDVEVMVTIESIDDGDDLDDSETIESIPETKKKSATITFTVPEKLDEGDYDVVIDIEGFEKDSNAKHSLTWELTLEVVKENHDVRITEAELGTETLSCMRHTNLRVTIANFGSRYESKAALSVFNSDLGINEQYLNIELDEDYEDSDNDYDRTISIDLDDDFPAGTYPIQIRAYYNTDKEMDTTWLNLVVEDCAINNNQQQDDSTNQDSSDVVVQAGDGLNQSGDQSAQTSNVVSTVETSFVESGWFIVILLIANLVAVVAVLILALKFLI